MSPPSNYLFLLFLPPIIPLGVFLCRVFKRHAIGRPNLILARVLNLFLYLRARAFRTISQAPTPHEEHPLATMSDLAIESARWGELLRESPVAIEEYLPEIAVDTELATFIRCVTFRVFLVVFLGVNPNPAKIQVQDVTRALSEFYDDRHGKSKLPPAVKKIVDAWIPPKRLGSSLDRILPAYEAIWRIVANIVVTCEDDKALRGVMLDFRDNPRDRQFSASFGSNKSASDITNDAVGRPMPILARPQHPAPLSCIQNATSGRWDGRSPTEQEALKFAGLLASMVIGRISGVHYGISGPADGSAGVSQGSSWSQRRIFKINHNPGPQTAINVVPVPHASTSRQNH